MSNTDVVNNNVNIPLLRKAVEWAEAEAAKPAIDSQWHQASWMLNPKTLALEIVCDLPNSRDLESEEFDNLVNQILPHCGTAYCIAGYVGQMLNPAYKDATAINGVHVKYFARDALGLTFDEADLLFDADNTIEDVRKISEEIAGERL